MERPTYVRPHIKDRLCTTVDLRKAWVFVLVLGFSRKMFARIVFDQTVPLARAARPLRQPMNRMAIAALVSTMPKSPSPLFRFLLEHCATRSMLL